MQHFPYYGWVIGYEHAGLNQTGVFNTALDSVKFGHVGAGIWQGGIALACDPEGNIYCSTGNGDFSAQAGGTGYGHCVLKLSPEMKLIDFFMPFNVADLDPHDWDLGSGAPMLIPQETGDPAPLLTICGKEGRIYVLNRSSLGRFGGGIGVGADNNIVQWLDLYPGQVPDGPGQPGGLDSSQPGVWGGPAYAVVGTKRLVFFCGNFGKHLRGDQSGPGGPVKAYSVNSSAQPFKEDFVSPGTPNQSLENFPAINAGGATPVLSSSGSDASTSIVWLVRRLRPLNLVALVSGDLTRKIAETNAGPWNNPRGAPMIEPTVIKGKIYVASDGELNVFGL
jgi:hypothetical protein